MKVNDWWYFSSQRDVDFYLHSFSSSMHADASRKLKIYINKCVASKCCNPNVIQQKYEESDSPYRFQCWAMDQNQEFESIALSLWNNDFKRAISFFVKNIKLSSIIWPQFFWYIFWEVSWWELIFLHWLQAPSKCEVKVLFWSLRIWETWSIMPFDEVVNAGVKIASSPRIPRPPKLMGKVACVHCCEFNFTFRIVSKIFLISLTKCCRKINNKSQINENPFRKT